MTRAQSCGCSFFLCRRASGIRLYASEYDCDERLKALANLGSTTE
jgi:hypothetical protein